MADFAGDAVGAGIQLIAQDQPGPDTGRHGDIDELAGSAGRAAPVLAQGGKMRVVMQKAANAGGAGKDPVEWHVAEARKVGGTDHQAGRWVDRSRHADAEGGHLAGRWSV